MPVRHIIFPKFKKDADTVLTPLPHAEALGRLMGECLALSQRLNQENVSKIVNWIKAIDCYTLTFSSLDDAVARVAAAAPRSGDGSDVHSV